MSYTCCRTNRQWYISTLLFCIKKQIKCKIFNVRSKSEWNQFSLPHKRKKNRSKTEQTIYSSHRRNLRCTGAPRFGLRGTVTHFSERKGEEFAVTWGNLQRLNYNKPFSIPLGKLITLSQTPELMRRDTVLPPYFPPLSPRNPTRNPRAPRSPSKLVYPIFRPKLRPW